MHGQAYKLTVYLPSENLQVKVNNLIKNKLPFCVEIKHFGILKNDSEISYKF